MDHRILTDTGRDATPPGQGVVFAAADLLSVVARAEHLLLRNRVYLDRLDASLGDGDHGENMSAGFIDARRALAADVPSADIGDLLRRFGHLLVAGVGGAGGSLYGTAFIEAGIAVAGLSSLDAAATARALDAAAEGIARRGRCRLGDKTISTPCDPRQMPSHGRSTPDSARRRRSSPQSALHATACTRPVR